MWGKFAHIFKGNTSRPFTKGDAQALLDRGKKLLLKGKYMQANECINKAVEIEIRLNEKKEAVSSLNKMGEFCDSFGEYCKAVIYYDQAEALDRKLVKKPSLTKKTTHVEQS